MHRRALVAPSLAVLIVGISANQVCGQAVTPLVDPPSMAKAAAVRGTAYPFGQPRITSLHYQEIRDGLAGTSRSIASIGLRRRAGSTGTVPAFHATFGLRLSTAPHKAADISDVFANNEGRDATTVLANRKVSFPAVAAVATSLQPFAYRLPTDRPYITSGKGPLCLDLSMSRHSNTTPFLFDLYEADRGYIGLLGKGCRGLNLDVSLSHPTVVPPTVSHTTTGLLANSSMFFVAGSVRKVPGDLSDYGAPGCFVYTTLGVVLAGTANGQGVHRLEFNTSAAPVGVDYACQSVGFDSVANALGITLSQSYLVLLRSRRDTGRVFSSSLSAKTGTAQPVFGLAWELR